MSDDSFHATPLLEAEPHGARPPERESASPDESEGRPRPDAFPTIADSVMYREALASAAGARGWSVHWYDRESLYRDAAAALGPGHEDAEVEAFLRAMGRSIGPPWQAKHELAAAAALAAAGRRGRPSPRPRP